MKNVDPLRGILSSLSVLRRFRPDILITYNWGSIEWAIAGRFFPGIRHIHFEAGFGKEEANEQIPRRVLCRRWALRRGTEVVVPSQVLMRIAKESWNIPADALHYIPNGVDINRFSQAKLFGQRVGRSHDELVVGSVAPLRPEKNIQRLLEAFALVDKTIPATLIIAGDGTERATLKHIAEVLGISGRVEFTGMVRPETVLGRFDVFALSSDTEQMPNALLEAMAARLPVAAVDVGDVKTIVSAENRQFIVPKDRSALGAAHEILLRDAGVRRKLALANFERVVAHFSLPRMLSSYAELFFSRGLHPDLEEGSKKGR